MSGIPPGTPSGDTIFVAGTFQGWQPGQQQWMLKKVARGYYQILINPDPGTIEYKFTRGNWSKSEKGKDGSLMNNRIYNYKGGPDTVTSIIHSWSDMIETPSTASDNVEVWKEDYYIGTLDRNRRIWVYLPPDYHTTQKHYPVLYMQDGQNVFDASTSYAGEWMVDETLNDLFEAGDHGCIVVAIDNGEDERLNEYSPWKNDRYGGGLGKKYVDFIVHALKPEIDNTFRTRADRENTAIMGSSLGGLISLYAGLEYPEVFSMVGSLSPAYWFSEESFDHAARSSSDPEIRIYTIAGELEGGLYLQKIEQMEQALLSAGHSESNIKLTFHTDGEHKEWYWAREFRDAYLWLFGKE